MNRLLLVLSVSLLTISCGQTTSNSYGNKDTLVVAQDTSIRRQDTNSISKNISDSKAEQAWTDPLIKNYINNSGNELIKLSFKNKISEQWLFDQTINTDTAKYFVFQVGHDELDEGETNKRFVTDQWIYIDSATKRLYEYDVANDSLIRWTK
jgi:hypothetical protein